MRIPDLEKKHWRYLLMGVLPLLMLLYLPATNLAILWTGERILLEVLPVDPRDLLRGDYVVLDYEISAIDESKLSDALRKEGAIPWRGLDVYVLLKPDNHGVGKVSQVQLERPASGLYLEGFLENRWNGYTCDYRLGMYFVPEGTGQELERAIQRGEVLADVRVIRGRPVIKKLEVQGEE